MDKTLHRLDEYLKLLEDHGLVSSHSVAPEGGNGLIRYISYNSKDIEQDTLFVCKGSHFSVEYLKAAIEKGAICYVSETKYDLMGTAKDVPFIIVNDIR